MAYGTRRLVPILSRINPIAHIDTYFFKIYSNIVSHLRLDLSESLLPICLPLKILKELLPLSILATGPARLNLVYWLYWVTGTNYIKLKILLMYSSI